MADNDSDIQIKPVIENGHTESGQISVKPVVASNEETAEVAIVENGVLYTVPQVSNEDGEIVEAPQVSAGAGDEGIVTEPQVSADADRIVNEVQVQTDGIQNEVQVATQNDTTVEAELFNNEENESEDVKFPDSVQKFFDDLIQSEGLQNVKIIIKPVSAKGDNFLGRLYRVKITGTNNDGEKDFKFVAKLAIDSEAVRSQLPLELFYKREIFMYTDVIRLYEDIQANLPESQRLRFPKCYFTDEKTLEECIILEDLAETGFTCHHRLNELSYDYASLFLKAIGKFHALSFKVQRDLPKLFEHYLKNTEDIVYSQWTGENEALGREYLRHSIQAAADVLENKEEKEKLLTFGLYNMDRVREAMNPPTYSVITHADCWIHNAMFRHEEGRPVACVLVDYQICRYASPVLDILNFIFSCTDHKLRKKHFDDLIEDYYSSLSDHLRLFSLDVHEVYPRKVFFAQLRKYSAFSIGYSITILPIMTKAEEEVQDLQELMESVLDATSSPGKDSSEKAAEANVVANSELFGSRVRDLVTDCISYGYL